jgi:hypothetical protein
MDGWRPSPRTRPSAPPLPPSPSRFPYSLLLFGSLVSVRFLLSLIFSRWLQVEQGGAVGSDFHSHWFDRAGDTPLFAASLASVIWFVDSIPFIRTVTGAGRVERQIQGQVWFRVHDMRVWEDCPWSLSWA